MHWRALCQRLHSSIFDLLWFVFLVSLLILDFIFTTHSGHSLVYCIRYTFDFLLLFLFLNGITESTVYETGKKNLHTSSRVVLCTLPSCSVCCFFVCVCVCCCCLFIFRSIHSCVFPSFFILFLCQFRCDQNWGNKMQRNLGNISSLSIQA